VSSPHPCLDAELSLPPLPLHVLEEPVSRSLHPDTPPTEHPADVESPGASRGIGSAIALELASRGANVLVHYSSSPEAAATVVSKIQALGVKSSSVKSDLGSKTCGNEIVDAAVAFSETGKIDILILNGAVARNMVLEEITMDTIDEHYTYVLLFSEGGGVELIDEGWIGLRWM
jgi:hypothetical protein